MSNQTNNQTNSGSGCSTWLLIIVLAFSFIAAKDFLFDRDKPSNHTSTGTTSSSVRWESDTNVAYWIPPAVEGYAVNMLPEEPSPYDTLTDSEYNNGLCRRRVSSYPDLITVTDYWGDGTILRESQFSYANDVFQQKRITNYDNYGNPTDVTEITADGELWLYLYYANVYDMDGRPVMLAEYNRFGSPLYIYEYIYNGDGSYCEIYSQYRGFVYEYDLPYNPDGTTSIFLRTTTIFNTAGDPINQTVEDYSLS